jgi:isochorismate pyruvate lyase
MTLEIIRKKIDLVDHEIIKLLKERATLVHEAAGHKVSLAHVADSDRVQRVLCERRKWAEAEGLSGDLVEEIYQVVIKHFVQEEKRVWLKQH